MNVPCSHEQVVMDPARPPQQGIRPMQHRLPGTNAMPSHQPQQPPPPAWPHGGQHGQWQQQFGVGQQSLGLHLVLQLQHGEPLVLLGLQGLPVAAGLESAAWAQQSAPVPILVQQWVPPPPPPPHSFATQQPPGSVQAPPRPQGMSVEAAAAAMQLAEARYLHQQQGLMVLQRRREGT
jgi:hypothetical protein